MKKIIYLLIFNLLFLLPTFSQNECLKQLKEKDIFIDKSSKKIIDSKFWINSSQNKMRTSPNIWIDSCLYSKTFGKPFAMKHYMLYLKKGNYPFDKQLSNDSIVQIHEISQNWKELKNQFLELKKVFGDFHFEGLENESNKNNFSENPWVLICFDDLQECELVFVKFKEIITSFKDLNLLNIINYCKVPSSY